MTENGSIFLHTNKPILMSPHPHTRYSQQFWPFPADIDLIACHHPSFSTTAHCPTLSKPHILIVPLLLSDWLPLQFIWERWGQGYGGFSAKPICHWNRWFRWRKKAPGPNDHKTIKDDAFRYSVSSHIVHALLKFNFSLNKAIFIFLCHLNILLKEHTTIFENRQIFQLPKS